MTLLVILLVVVPVSFAIGWFVIGPLVGGDPPFTHPKFSAYVSVWCPRLRRRWPPYSQRERDYVRGVRSDYLGPFA